jgi:insulysin
MKDEEFESHKTALINKRLEKMKNLNQESGRFWHHVTSEAFDFELGKSCALQVRNDVY